MTFRSAKKQAKEVYLYEPINRDDGEGNSINLLDLLETTDEDVAERMETEENVKKLYKYVETALPGTGFQETRLLMKKMKLLNGKSPKNMGLAEAT